ncbi:P-loop nucleoside triphosphate hydrolase superfamily protein, putative [Medicago truncatula]|uniref:P-loop nucleoside triphosphate hydrolase superfamily protein, putative n=1 Tax=Medicago truncatula TaxID=3880 RepID=A0A072U8N4_MEDTR|nr:P-loop nucleoside triphosphate hydrolase superfamily protein, putative [Medicago truncatula]
MLQFLENYRDLSVPPADHINQDLTNAKMIATSNSMLQQQVQLRHLVSQHHLRLNGGMVEQPDRKKRKNADDLIGSSSAPVSRPCICGGKSGLPINTGNVTSQIARNYGLPSMGSTNTTNKCLNDLHGPDGQLPEKLRNVTPYYIEQVSNEIMDKNPDVHWNDIAGLTHAKKCVNEMAVLPLRRPDLFMGCRSPGRGLLLFGPPGTGKTMIGKAIAGEAKATFFYISASSLTSKCFGEGEKLVTALFGVASCRQPAVIFVDEIDSLVSGMLMSWPIKATLIFIARPRNEYEVTGRIKTQFLIEMEGFAGGNEQVLVIGATNRPQDLDEVAQRRLTKRLYIPLPSSDARAWIARNLLEKDGLFKLSNEEMEIIRDLTDGYSGLDMTNLVKDASMGPLREAMEQGIDIMELKKEDMRPVTLQDFMNSMQEIRPSVSPNELGTFEQWNKQFRGCPLIVWRQSITHSIVILMGMVFIFC